MCITVSSFKCQQAQTAQKWPSREVRLSRSAQADLCPAMQEGPTTAASLLLPVLRFFLSCPVAQSISSAPTAGFETEPIKQRDWLSHSDQMTEAQTETFPSNFQLRHAQILLSPSTLVLPFTASSAFVLRLQEKQRSK